MSSFPGRPIPPTSSSSLLPSAQLPSSHNPPPVSCQMPLLDSNTSHQIMDTNPDEEFSPNSYLLRACSGPQQASSSGKKNCKHMEFVCDVFVLVLYIILQMCSFITWKLRACREMRQKIIVLFHQNFFENILYVFLLFFYRDLFKCYKHCKIITESLSSKKFSFQSVFLVKEIYTQWSFYSAQAKPTPNVVMRFCIWKCVPSATVCVFLL